MPLIQPEKKIINKKLDVNVPEEFLQELRAYAAYLDGQVGSHAALKPASKGKETV
jgi:hypothetical protein